MDWLEDLTSKISHTGSSINLGNSSISLNEQWNISSEDMKEIIYNLDQISNLIKDKSQMSENLKSYFIENEGLTLLLILFEDVSWDNDEVALSILKILNSLGEMSKVVSLSKLIFFKFREM